MSRTYAVTVRSLQRAHQAVTDLAKRQAALDLEQARINREAGAALRQWRHEDGLTLDVLAKRLSITKSHLSDVELGQRNPGPILARIFRDR